ncbi:MAG: NUDIX domain-containing protein [Thaumarchaeota archaeon]|nr:NUDIX domain-containing protein [Nitrososphaerota archaeon]
MNSTSIVTVFLTCNNKYLILKRSSKVKTMKNLWAGISGIIEGDEDPTYRAKREVFEEAGISEDKITILKTAEPMSVESQYNDHEWKIHPYLFAVNDITITLNWENSDYTWISPSELSKYQTVPSLEKVLARLL